MDKPAPVAHRAGMVTPAALLADRGSALVIDAAAGRIHAGLLRRGAPPVWATDDREAGVAVFVTVARVLAGTGLRPDTVGAYVYGAGPGSQLGLRTAAMAIRTWRALRAELAPVFAYRGLERAARALARTTRPAIVLLDARRGDWHVVRIGLDGGMSCVERVAGAELAAEGPPLFQPEGFRAWSALPRETATCPYDVPGFFARDGEDDWLEPVAEPEPWPGSAPEYRRWSGERHRAPSSPA